MVRVIRKALLIIYALGILTLTPITPTALLAAAAGTAMACADGSNGFSVIFLVDQSASMSQTTGGSAQIPPSDPGQQRKYAPAYALTRLGEEHLFAEGNPVYSLGVISFGTNARTDLPLTAMTPDPKDPVGWASQDQQLVGQLKADSLGDTDFQPAFNQAAQEFQSAQQACGNKLGQKAIVLITDGGPCVLAQGCDPNTPFWSDDQTYMQNLTQHLEETFPQKDYRLWVLTLSVPQAQDLPRVAPFWTALTKYYNGQLIPLQNNQADVADQVARVLEQLGLELRTPTCGNGNYVDPYVGQLSLWFLKPSPGQTVQVTLPDGSTVASNDPRILLHQSFGANEELVIGSPPPGQWTFSGCSNVVIVERDFQPVARLRAPTGVITAGTKEAPLTYSLVDANGNPIPSNPSFPLTWVADVTNPQGTKSSTCQLQPTDTSGVFSCAGLSDAAPGTYQVHVVAEAKSANPYPQPRSFPRSPQCTGFGLPSIASTDFFVAEDCGATYQVAQATSTAVPAPTLVPSATPAMPTTLPTAPPIAVPTSVPTTAPQVATSVPKPTSTPIPPPPPPPPLLEILAVLLLLAVLVGGGIAFMLSRQAGPRGSLTFTGATGDVRGDLPLVGRGVLRLNRERCEQRLPGIGLVSLIVEPGLPADGHSTIRLTLEGVDGHHVNGQIFHDGDTAFVDDLGDCHVTYTAVVVGGSTPTREPDPFAGV
jgi:hypothetical protein